MCGFAGYIACNSPVDHSVLSGMLSAISHRGPDSAGTWTNTSSSIGLVHSRLSIIDPSSSGSQPIHSHDGSLSLVFNGEIYNHLELRHDLDKSYPIKWRGSSDTETLLNALVFWGLENTLPRLQGMFAFALWNESQKNPFNCS